MYIKIHIDKYESELNMLVEHCKKYLKFDDISFIDIEQFITISNDLYMYTSWFYYKYYNGGLIFIVNCTQNANKSEQIILSMVNGVREYFIDFVRIEKLRYIENL